jgi:hypothetical protein
MADESPKTGSWWATIPGILTASAGVITAATGLLAILAQNGLFGEKNKPIASEKVAAVREAVTSTAPSSSSSPATTAAKPASSAATAPGTPAGAPPSTARDGVATGISSAPLHAVPFTGAVVTLLDGSIVKLRDDVREYYGGTTLRTTSGQAIEMQRMRRFEVSDWKETKGNVRITLNSGEVIDVRAEAYLLRGSNDLGDFSANFDKIRSVDFVR